MVVWRLHNLAWQLVRSDFSSEISLVLLAFLRSVFSRLEDSVNNRLLLSCDETRKQLLEGSRKSPKRRSDSEPRCCLRDLRGCCSSGGFSRTGWLWHIKKRTKKNTEGFCPWTTWLLLYSRLATTH